MKVEKEKKIERNYTPRASLTFAELIDNYQRVQSEVVAEVKSVGKELSQVSPGKFLLLQFQMSQVSQVGESISNLISQVQATINTAIRNQRSG